MNEQAPAGLRPTNRIEAFSDGVFAIAITLLILEVRVPRELGEGASLAAALLALWPSYLAFVTSFATIGIMWVNHHRLYDHIARADHMLFLLNSLLLLGITFVPFPTTLIAEYINHPDGRAAALLYSGTSILLAVFFNLLWRYVAFRPHLLKPDVDPRSVQAITRQYVFGPVVYLVAFAVAWVNVLASLLICLGLAIFFALPPRRQA